MKRILQTVHYHLLFSQHVGGIVLEDLHFQQSHDTNKYSNRKFLQFTYKKMVSSLIRMGLRNGFSVKTVIPAYTSVIGKLKYSKKYGISVHETAAFTIARRGLGLQEKLPKEMISLLQNQISTKLCILIASLEESDKNTKRYIRNGYKPSQHGKIITTGNYGVSFIKQCI